MKTIRVEEVYGLHGTASTSVCEDISMEGVISRFAYEPDLRAISLVDSRQRFVGVITRADLLKWSTIILLRGKVGVASVGEARRLVSATKANDLRRSDWPLLGVWETDTLETAVNQMLSCNEETIPVLDSEGRILGDLRLSEVLLKAIEVGRQFRGNGPDS